MPVAGRPHKCRSRAAVTPPSKTPGSQHVRAIVPGPLRQQRHPQLPGQRRRLQQRPPPALGQQLTFGPRGGGRRGRRRGAGRAVPAMHQAPAAAALASRELRVRRRVAQHRGGTASPRGRATTAAATTRATAVCRTEKATAATREQDHRAGGCGGGAVAAAVASVTAASASATGARGTEGTDAAASGHEQVGAVHQDGAEAGGPARQSRLALQDAQVLSSMSRSL